MKTPMHHEPPVNGPALTRRAFLAAGGTVLSAAAVRVTTPDARAAADPDPAGFPEIVPGYVGPHFFDEAEERALLEVMEAGSPFRYWGPGRPDKVERFEEAFAHRMKTRFALGVTSGTAALDCAMAALGIGPGDEVIIPSYTWWSDYTCVIHAGALPVFAEIDRTLNLDPADFERKITPRTKAVIPVHLLGGPCDMDPILELARKHGIGVVEDCAQCVGGSYRGQPLGSMGDIGIYSFQINKMMTSGEGGALVTNDPVLYERAVLFHDMGTPVRQPFLSRIGNQRRVAAFPGENFRMSELTGSVLGAQLPKLDTMIERLRAHSEPIYERIVDIAGIRLRHRPDPRGDVGYGVYFEVADKAERDRCIRELRQRKVPASTLTGSVLLPLEESVIEKRARHPDWPSFQDAEGSRIRYGADNCPQTCAIFDRFIQVRMGPGYTPRIDRHIIDSIDRVCHTGLAHVSSGA